MIKLKLLLDSSRIQYHIDDTLLEKEFLAFLPYKQHAPDKEHTLYLSDEKYSAVNRRDVIYVKKELEQMGHDIAAIISDLSVKELCECLNEAANDFIVWLDKLLMIMQKNDSISKLIPIINLKLKNPIVIFDMSYKLLGYSEFFEVENDPEWGKNILKGYVSLSENRNKVLKTVLSDRQLKEKGNTYKLDEFEHRFFSKRLFYNHETIGMFTVIEQKEIISEFSIELIQSIAPIMETVVFLEQSKTYSTMKSYEYLLKDLISNSDISMKEINERLHFEKYTLKPPFAVCSIQMKDSDHYNYPGILYLNGNIHFTYSNYHVFLIENYSEEFRYRLKKEITAHLKRMKAIAGISTQFEAIADFREKYQESIKAIYFNKSSNTYSLYNYNDCLMDDLFYMVSAISDIDKYLYMPVVTLMEKDKLLYDTLVVYIKQINSQKGAAISLGIHRTTLLYRLRKIQEEYGIDFNNADIIFQIVVTVKIIENRYRKKFT